MFVGVLAVKMPEDVNINATGMPDTPMEVINKLLKDSIEAPSPEQMKELLQEAYRISSGLDPYLDRMLSPVPQACTDLISASDEHDWEEVFNQVCISHTSISLGNVRL